LFKATAGNWDVPHSSGDGAFSNIVPVVANGHVYVASYKELDIFGFGPPITKLPEAPTVAPPPEPPVTDGITSIFGTITKIEGSRFAMKIQAGTEVQVDAENALKNGLSPDLVVGQSVSVYGIADTQGVLHAEVIKHPPAPKKP
jgi:hypothetical protein